MFARMEAILGDPKSFTSLGTSLSILTTIVCAKGVKWLPAPLRVDNLDTFVHTIVLGGLPNFLELRQEVRTFCK